MDLQLKNKVMLIAGASKGLGYAVAHALAAEGATVSISSRDQASITSAGERIERETGAKVFAMPVDVRSSEAIAKWIAAAADRLEALYDAHLVEQPVEDRYRLHDLVRDHAQACVERDDSEPLREQALRRLVDW